MRCSFSCVFYKERAETAVDVQSDVVLESELTELTDGIDDTLREARCRSDND